MAYTARMPKIWPGQNGAGSKNTNPASMVHSPYHHGERNHKKTILGIRKRSRIGRNQSQQNKHSTTTPTTDYTDTKYHTGTNINTATNANSNTNFNTNDNTNSNAKDNTNTDTRTNKPNTSHQHRAHKPTPGMRRRRGARNQAESSSPVHEQERGKVWYKLLSSEC